MINFPSNYFERCLKIVFFRYLASNIETDIKMTTNQITAISYWSDSLMPAATLLAGELYLDVVC